MSSTSEAAQEPHGSRTASIGESLRRDGRERVESGKRAAAEHIEDIADAIDIAGSHLDQSQPQLARYATRLADGVAGVAARLRDSNLEDLSRDARQFAARNPALFVIGSAALGVVLARFLKALPAENRGQQDGEYRSGASANGG